MYKVGCTNKPMTKLIQEVVGSPIDGIFGPLTQRYVINWQSANNLVADGIVGPKTLDAMGILDTDIKEHHVLIPDENLIYEEYHLPEGQYIKQDYKILNDYLFIHHTAGWNNPYNTIDHWARDKRGRVATEFVIGGQNIRTNDDTYDGLILQAFPEGCQGWHIGNSGSYYMNRHSVGIEVNSFGYLTNDGKTYTGQKANKDQIAVLEEPFRKKKKWHKYSDEQLIALSKLILFISGRDNIDIREGLIKWIKESGPIAAFEFQKDAYEGKVKGLLTHTNVRKDKTDMFPQQELIDMLLSL